MRDLICDVIIYCGSSFALRNMKDQVAIKNLKTEEMCMKEFFPYNR